MRHPVVQNSLCMVGVCTWVMSLSSVMAGWDAAESPNTLVNTRGTTGTGGGWHAAESADITVNTHWLQRGVSAVSPVRIVDTRDSVLRVAIEAKSGYLQWFVGNPIRFRASVWGAGGDLTYAWDLDGDGTYNDGSAREVGWTFNAEGYTVMGVRVADDTDSATAALIVSVGKRPVADESEVRPAPDPILGRCFNADGSEPFVFHDSKKTNGFLLITHGVRSSARPPRSDWLVEMASAVKARLAAEGVGEPNICLYDWRETANPSRLDAICPSGPTPNVCHKVDLVRDISVIRPFGLVQGDLLAQWLSQCIDAGSIDPRAPVHLIGHSAGGFVVGQAGFRVGLRLTDDHVTFLDTPFPYELHVVAYPLLGRLERIVSSGWGLLRTDVVPGPNSPYVMLLRSRHNGRTLVELADAWHTEYDHGYAHEWFIKTAQSNIVEGFYYSPFLDNGFYGAFDHMPGGKYIAQSEEAPIHCRESTNSIEYAFDSFGDVVLSNGVYTANESANAGIYGTIQFPLHARTLRFEYQFASPGGGDFLSVHVGSNRTVFVGVDTAFSQTNWVEAAADVRHFAGTSSLLTFKLVSRGAANATVRIRDLRFVYALDSDGDGIGDDIETGTGVFLSEYDTGTDPMQADTDHDGASDGDEVLASTDPGDSTDVFKILWAEASTSSVVLQWSAKAGLTYRVEAAPQLTGSWIDAPSGIGLEEQSERTALSDGILQYLDATDISRTNGFYRIRLSP